MLEVTRDMDGSFVTMTMRRPSNFHAHVRRGALMRAVAWPTMKFVKYLLIMPNTGPILTIADAERYRTELVSIRDEHVCHAEFIMTLYHTAKITPRVVLQMVNSPITYAVKHYPPYAGATTGSGLGIALDAPESVDMLKAMQENGVRLLGHFEDVYDNNGRELPHELRDAHCIENRVRRLRDYVS